MIGDVLVSSIICNNLRTAYPDAQIDYLVYESTTPVLEGNLNINNIILFKAEHKNSKLAFFKLALQLRKENYDLIIDAYSKMESWLLVLLNGAKRRISYKKVGRDFLYTDNVPFTEFPKTNLGLAIERRLSLLKPLNLDIAINPFPKLFVTQKENRDAIALFEKNQVKKNRKTAMISILGSENLKTYPLQYMSMIVDKIADEFDVNILFNYFPKQIDQAKLVYENCKPETQKKIYFELLGNDLRTFVAIMNNCDCIIGNDGGAINMAKALDKPSFIIFSPWIEKKIWATFEDGVNYTSVHLNDFIPELFKNKSEKEIKKNTLLLYQKFEPALFTNKIKAFLTPIFSDYRKEKIEIIPDKKLFLSVLIITYNEEKNIAALLTDLDFANEIIIVDSFSTDNTFAIAKSFKNATVVQHKFENYAAQRNYAISLATNPWILFLDSDERLTPKLKSEIQLKIQLNEDVSAYYFYRIFMFKNSKLHFSGWQTDKIHRLFQKDKAHYDSRKIVHEKLIVSGKSSKLKNKLIHYSYTDYSSYKSKMISYGKMKAKEEFNKGTNPNFFYLFIRPAYKFIYQFLIRLGFLDGKNGLIICYLNALSVYVRFEELKKLKSKN